MNKFKNLSTNAKVTLITALIILLIAIIYLLSYSREMKEKQNLTNKLYNVASEFYKDYYYQVVGNSDEERASYVSRFNETGITISLEDMVKYKLDDSESILNEFKNYKTKANCDYENTQVIIYPYDPYGVEDFNIDATLVCGFK